MTNKKYTLWNMPQSEWTQVLEGVEIDAATLNEIKDIMRNHDHTDLDKRLAKFDIPVSAVTMFKVI